MLENPKQTKDAIVQWIRDYFDANGPHCDAVVGISGGKDSSVVAALCVEALGKERVVGVLMPCGEQIDIDDSKRIVETLGIRSYMVNIQSPVDSILFRVRIKMEVSEQTKVNLPARIRMTTLYAVAQSLPNGGRVASTCNRSEDFVGYSTKFGDSAGDFSPLANLLVSEVIQIGHELPIPKDLIDKTPSDGLCGKSDEDNLGFTYAQLDQFILIGTTGDKELDDKITKMHDHNLHKLLPMPSFSCREPVMRKYLDDIGVTQRPDTWNMDDKRQGAWALERAKYGFDERETWNLDFTFHLWLYERLKKFVDVCCVNLDYHKFEYNGKEYTQRQMIDMMIERLEFSFKPEYNDHDEKQYDYVSEIEKIWSIVFPAMWW